MHATHRRAHDEQHVIQSEAFGRKAILRRDHVFVAVLRKLAFQSVARLARASRTDAVGKDDEVCGRIEELSLSKQDAAKSPAHESTATPSGSMENHHGVV